MEKEKIRFKDLSGALKTAVVFSYIIGGYLALVFAVGLITGIFGLFA